MEKLISTPCFPHDPPSILRKPQNKNSSEAPRQIGGGIVALGARWLAYPGTELLQNTQEDSSAPGAIDNLVEVAKYIGDVSYKTVSSYMYPEAQPVQSSTEKDNGAAGTVVVYDIFTNAAIAHFRAHRQPIGTLAFDPSGTLLVTASAEGYHFNVYQINPTQASQTFTHIYTLVRGRTTATITGISFSNDSRWMAASTARGTTHIYAINPEGGPVNVHTHIPSEPITSFEAPFLMNFMKPKHLTLPVCNRIKQDIPTDLEETGRVPCTVAAFRPLGGATPRVKILTISQIGVLMEYDLLPHPPVQPSDLDPKTLMLDTEPTFYWDTCRRSSWAQFLMRLKTRKPTNSSMGDQIAGEEDEPRWLANIEICTHTPYYRPLWAGPQFTFKTFQKGIAEDDASKEHKVKVRYTPVPSRKLSLSTTSDLSFGTEMDAGPVFPPSASPEKEELVREDIINAMATPLEVPRAPAGDSGFISDSYLGGFKAQRNSHSPTLPASSPPLRDRPALSFPDVGIAGEGKAKGLSESPVRLDVQPGLNFYYDEEF